LLPHSRWAWQRFPLTLWRLGAVALVEGVVIVAAESLTEAVPIVAAPIAAESLTEAVPIAAESPTEAATIAAAAGTPALQPEPLLSARRPQARITITTITPRSADIIRIRPANSQVRAAPRRIS